MSVCLCEIILILVLNCVIKSSEEKLSVDFFSKLKRVVIDLDKYYEGRPMLPWLRVLRSNAYLYLVQ